MIWEEIDGYLPLPQATISEAEVLNALTFLTQKGAELKQHCTTLGVNVDETVLVDGESFPLYDFTTMDHQDFLLAEADLLMFMTDDLWSHGADWIEWSRLELMNAQQSNVEPAGIELLENEFNTSIEVTLIVKLAAIFGLSRSELAAFDEALAETGSKSFKLASHQLNKGNYRKAAGHIKDGLKTVTGKRFRDKLVKQLGKKTAGKVLAKIGSKFVPWIGWGVLVGGIVWEAGTQIFAD